MRRITAAAAFIICIYMLFCACAKTPDQKTDPTAAPATEAPVVTEAPKDTEPPTAEPEPTEEPTPAKAVVNVVLGKSATADYTERGGTCGPADLVCDGDETTRWSGFDLSRPQWRDNLTYWVVIDLAGTFTLTDFYIMFESLTGFYSIQVSDTGEDGSWKSVYVYDEVNLGPAALTDEGTFEAGTTAAFVRILVEYPEDEIFSSGYPYVSIYEFECYGYSEEGGADA
ncbi:MAG: discoidin domain-containing protein [Clostridia bacterium]|nr:discoidin domain-containing protein [Clostridia bacterium]